MARNAKLPKGMYKRGNVYWCDFRCNGRRIQQSLSTQFDAARQILNDLRSKADKQDFGILDNGYPLAKLRDEFLRAARQTCRESTFNSYESSLRLVLAQLPVQKVTQVSKELLRDFREQYLGDGAEGRTVNRLVTVFKTMLNWGVTENKIGTNPIATLKPLKDYHVKEGRAFTDDEIRRLLEASEQPWRDIWYAFLVTGVRLAELAGLLFSDIDWARGDIIIRAEIAKNHNERRIPIEGGLFDILKRQEAARKDRKPGKSQSAAITVQVQNNFSRDVVFVTTANTPLTHRSNLLAKLMRCCKDADIVTKTLDADGKVLEHVDIHSFRRTFATNLIENGTDPKTVQTLLGHATLNMTMGLYAKCRTGNQRQALNRLSYGNGSLAPATILEYPGEVAKTANGSCDSPTVTEKRKEA